MQRLTLPQTVPADVEAWLLTLDLQMPLHASDLSILNDSERKHAQSLHFHDDRVRSVVTRAALRKLLAARVMMAPETLLFRLNNHGKPSLQGNTSIEFNVSHAGCFALIALSSQRQVGVDIECINRSIDIHNLSRYVFSPLERQSVQMTQQAFMLRWVAKESALKALGLGISEHLQAISIVSNECTDYQIVYDHPEWPELKGWLIELPADDYLAALTVEC